MLLVELSQARNQHQNQKIYENVCILSQLQERLDCKFFECIFLLIIDTINDLGNFECENGIYVNKLREFIDNKINNI